jgi:RNAse (barnase) inhibitor barstar
MDMKRILQAMDSVATQPVVGANDMSKFLSIIDKNNVSVLKEEQNNNQVLSEGTNPHKVALPVQMAMQHYQQPKKMLERKNSIIYKYFEQIEEEHLQEQTNKKQLLNQYASQIAERVLGRKK